MNTEQKLGLVKEALRDWRDGVLTDGAALLVIGVAVEDQKKPSKKAIKKVIELYEKDKKEKKYGQKS